MHICVPRVYLKRPEECIGYRGAAGNIQLRAAMVVLGIKPRPVAREAGALHC